MDVVRFKFKTNLFPHLVGTCLRTNFLKENKRLITDILLLCRIINCVCRIINCVITKQLGSYLSLVESQWCRFGDSFDYPNLIFNVSDQVSWFLHRSQLQNVLPFINNEMSTKMSCFWSKAWSGLIDKVTRSCME